ncbi:MAG: hypothetical protein JJU20_10150 [Opitutales bacterium]|nr:hypothetical protein [Opitutales bacterium]
MQFEITQVAAPGAALLDGNSGFVGSHKIELNQDQEKGATPESPFLILILNLDLDPRIKKRNWTGIRVATKRFCLPQNPYFTFQMDRDA